MIKVGIIGAGNIAPAHIQGYLRFPELCEVVAVCDIYEDKAKGMIDHFALRNARSCGDYHALLDAGLDLVSLCTPPFTHAALTVDFMRSGAHVLVEKPMASSLAECDDMNRAAQESGKILSVVAQNRFRTPMMKLKTLLDSGLPGRILHTQVDSHWWRGHCYYDLWWRGTWEKEGGGCTLNHAVHHIDALLWMMGLPEEVTAVMGNTAHDNAEVEDLSMALLRFPGGALGQITSSVVHHGEEQQLIFQCLDARVSFPWKVYASASKPNGFPEKNEKLQQEIEAYYDSLPALAEEFHAGQIGNMLNTIAGKEKLLIDGAGGKAALELIMGIYSSAASGKPVFLPLGSSDPFYTRKGVQDKAPHFYTKNVSVENLPGSIG